MLSSIFHIAVSRNDSVRLYRGMSHRSKIRFGLMTRNIQRAKERWGVSEILKFYLVHNWGHYVRVRSSFFSLSMKCERIFPIITIFLHMFLASRRCYGHVTLPVVLCVWRSDKAKLRRTTSSPSLCLFWVYG